MEKRPVICGRCGAASCARKSAGVRVTAKTGSRKNRILRFGNMGIAGPFDESRERSYVVADYTGFAKLMIPAQIGDTSVVHGILRSLAIVAVACALSVSCQTPAPAWQSAVDRAARQSPDARIIVLDIATGRLLASHQLPDAARTVAAPGSTLKPLVLYSLIREGLWNSSRRVACNRQLVVAGHRLACTHPLAPPFDAREALTWSCNSYFAAVARSLQPWRVRPSSAPYWIARPHRPFAAGSRGGISRA